MASTVHGTIKSAFNGTPFVGAVRFVSLSTPEAVDDVVILGQGKTISTDSEGAFSIELAPGAYKVTANFDTFNITVPEDDGTFEITTISNLVIILTAGISIYWPFFY